MCEAERADEIVLALRLGDPPATKGMRTICEVLRELGRDAEIRGDVVGLRKILEATHMAKRMSRALDERRAQSGGDISVEQYVEDQRKAAANLIGKPYTVR